MAPFENNKAEPVNPHDNIHLRLVGEAGLEIEYYVNFNDPLGLIMEDFAAQMEVRLEDLRFLFDGRRMMSEYTPQSLAMEENDVIEVYDNRYVVLFNRRFV